MNTTDPTYTQAEVDVLNRRIAVLEQQRHHLNRIAGVLSCMTAKCAYGLPDKAVAVMFSDKVMDLMLPEGWEEVMRRIASTGKVL
jgi:hypothetical protein